MKVSDICKTLGGINRLRDVMLQYKHDLTTQEIFSGIIERIF